MGNFCPVYQMSPTVQLSLKKTNKIFLSCPAFLKSYSDSVRPYCYFSRFQSLHNRGTVATFTYLNVKRLCLVKSAELLRLKR